MTENEKRRVEDFEHNYKWLADIPAWKMLALADMAAHNVYPDGTFGDDECVVWQKFRRIFEDKENSII